MTVAGAIIICLFGNAEVCTTYNKQFETIAECEFEAKLIEEKIKERKEFDFAGFSCTNTSK